MVRIIQTAVLLTGTMVVLAGCEPGVTPDSPANSEQGSTSYTGQNPNKQGSDHSADGDGTRQPDNSSRLVELQISLDFAKSELQRFEVALKERQQQAIERVTVAQLKGDELQKKITRYTDKMTKQALTNQETLELEQAKRDKADADRQLASEKDLRPLNEKPVEALIQAKRDEIIRLEATLLALKSSQPKP